MGIFCPNNNNENPNPELKLPLNDLNMDKTPDQFLCSLCATVPEILKIHSDSGIIEFKCFEHGVMKLPIDKYIEEIRNSPFYCPNLKCDNIKCNTENTEQKFKFCQVCKNNLCENCLNEDKCLGLNKSNINKRISISEKNNKCPNHCELDITDFCLDCQENYCKKDEEHEKHNTKKTKDLLDEALKYEGIIERKNNNLYYIAKLYLSIKNKTVNNQNKLENLLNNINEEEKTKEIELITNYFEKNKIVEKKKNSSIEEKIDSNCTDLSLKSEQLTDADSYLISKIKFESLQTIELSNNKLTNLDFLENMYYLKLKSIDFSQNEITNIDSIIFLDPELLEIINLEKNLLEADALEILNHTDFKKLKQLNIINNKLKKNEISKNLKNKYAGKLLSNSK